jgi:hypothetical protein
MSQTSGPIENSENSEKLFVITESLESGVQHVYPIYAPSELFVAQYLLDHRNDLAFFQNQSYDNLFTYIVEFIEKDQGQPIPDEDIDGLFDALENYITAPNILEILRDSTIQGTDSAGYKIEEFPLVRIPVAYPPPE